MNRRQLVSLLGAAVAAGGNVASAQTPTGRPRDVGVMMAISENDPEGQARVDALRRSLVEAGWEQGRNVNIDVGWYRGNYQIAQEIARRLISGGAEVIVVNGTPGMDALRAVGANLPIVFVVVSNPVGAGYVPNLSRPGGNITGFSTFEPEMAGKWVQLLRQASPGLKHVSMLLDPKFIGFHSLWQGVDDIAPKLGLVPHAAYASSLQEIERALDTMASQDMPGLIVSPSPVNTVNRARLIALANDRRIPAIYPFRFYVREGALLAYGFNAADQFKRAGAYVNRILKGEKPGDLPVQAPSVFELGVNLKTARAMGLAVPQSLLISADEIVE
ncbi:MAG: ABC transporter substrate-binding protein [Hyphomicrobiales bacterium]|nr:ABC transporter substrate-binding protein [Hyphomicrobiales bacterium]